MEYGHFRARGLSAKQGPFQRAQFVRQLVRRAQDLSEIIMDRPVIINNQDSMIVLRVDIHNQKAGKAKDMPDGNEAVREPSHASGSRQPAQFSGSDGRILENTGGVRDPSTQPTDEFRTSVPPGCWQQESPGGLTSHSGAVFGGRSAPALEFHFGVDNPDEVTD